MLGAIIGDMVGSRFEFNNTNSVDFELFTKECSYTDDTICTIAIADAILNGDNYKESLLKWCRKYPNPKGAYGASFARWILSKDPQPYNSYGNGSAMRVSPIGWAFNSSEEVIRQAKLSAEVSHNHPEGIKGAQCVADLIFRLRTGKMEKKDIKEYVKHEFNYEIPPVAQIRKGNNFDETCQVTVPQSIGCFLEANDFEETIRLAISIGGDSDTIGAIAGSLAEAYYDIPLIIKHEALKLLPKDMEVILDQFDCLYPNHR